MDISTFEPLRNQRPSTLASAGQGLSTAYESLAAHKLRAALTVISTTIGIAGVVAVGALGEMSRAVVERQFGQLGATLISVVQEPPPPPPGAEVVVKPGPGGGPMVKGQAPADNVSSSGGGPTVAASRLGMVVELDDKDAAAIRALPHVVAASPNLAGPPMQIVAGSQNVTARVMGVAPDIQRIFGYRLEAGAFFSEQDAVSSQPVVVLGHEVARNLGDPAGLVGQSVRIGNMDFTVAGVLAAQGSTGESTLDDVGFVPYGIVERLRGNVRMFILGGSPLESSGVIVQVDSVDNVPQVSTSIKQLVDQQHPQRENQMPFVTRTFDQALQSQQAAMSTVSLVMSAIAIVALAIGMLGLLSVMTVSVAERRREIGIRVAVGARQVDVLLQFLIEAACIALLGGLAGVLLGLVGSPFIPRLAGEGDVVAAPSVLFVVAAPLIALAIGVVFGYLPAWRASRLDPVTALRRG